MTTSKFQICIAENRLRKIAESLDPSTRADLEPVLSILAGMSKQEMRKWLKMKPSEMKLLSNQKVYALMSKLLPDIEKLESQLGQLQQIFDKLGDTAITRQVKKSKTNVLQFNDILVAVLTKKNPRYGEIVWYLHSKYPKLQKKIESLVKKKVTISTALLKTTVQKLESGNKSKFPTKKPPHVLIPYTAEMKMAETVAKTASLVSFFESLYVKSKETLLAAWEFIRIEYQLVYKSLVRDIDDIDTDLTEMTKELEQYL